MGDEFVVTPPSHRFDIEIEEDLVEELVRYSAMRTFPHPALKGRWPCSRAPNPARSTWAVRHRPADRDYQEVVNFAFVEERWEQDFAGNAAPIRVAEPDREPVERDASSLIAGSSATWLPTGIGGVARVRVFETGHVAALPSEGAPTALTSW